MPLNATTIKHLKPGKHSDGAGLYLRLNANGTGAWAYIFMDHGRSHDMGLGSYPTVSLKLAREKAREAQQLRARGIDPLAERMAEKQKAMADQRTFASVMQACWEDRSPGWDNAKHIALWKSSLTQHALPILGKLPIDAISVEHVLRVLKPIWTKHPATASRVRGRIEMVLGYARANGWRTAENPAAWKGGLKDILAAPSKVRPVENHPALPFAEIPAFMAKLRASEGTAMRGLELLILTGVRSGALRKATWDEFDLDAAIWSIPAAHEKSRRPHRVPLSDRAVEILRGLQATAISHRVIPGRDGAMASTMIFENALAKLRDDCVPHGFRSTLRDWIGEETNHSADIAECTLSHKFGGVRGDYQRGSLFQKRRVLMADWASYCDGRWVVALAA